jgi:hypothetical protein
MCYGDECHILQPFRSQTLVKEYIYTISTYVKITIFRKAYKLINLLKVWADNWDLQSWNAATCTGMQEATKNLKHFVGGDGEELKERDTHSSWQQKRET